MPDYDVLHSDSMSTDPRITPRNAFRRFDMSFQCLYAHVVALKRRRQNRQDLQDFF
jgi:hypothetical protein